MFTFNFDYSNYRKLLADFAKYLHTSVTPDYKLIFPKEYAIGYMQTIPLPNELEILLFDYTLVKNFFGKRNAAQEEFYILWLTEAYIPDSAHFLVENNTLDSKATSFTTVMLTSSLFDLGFDAKKGTRFNGLNIIITKDWLYKEMGISNTDEVLQHYLGIKTQKISSEVLSIEYKKIWGEIVELVAGSQYLKEVSIQNKCMQLIELFLTNMQKKMQQSDAKIKHLNRDDINRMMQAEKYICEDLFGPPPTIKSIAKHFNISEAKFKNDFKLVYNLPPHKHFQKKRMLAAKDLLLLKKYSIKQIATEFGFSNQHNFTIAFKKEFGILPSMLTS